MLYALLPPPWMKDADPNILPLQLDTTFEEAFELNKLGYGLYYYPNGMTSEAYESLSTNSEGEKRFVKAGDIDKFDWIFVDLDMKHGVYDSIETFVAKVLEFPLAPTKIILSGNGVHGYWKVSDLDAMSFLRLTRRLCRYFNTDPAVCQIKQLMRLEGSLHTKDPNNFKSVEKIVDEPGSVYTCEQVDKVLPPITTADEAFCKQHHDRAYSIEDLSIKISDSLPRKFLKLMKESKEVKELYAGESDDRSKADWRLAHLLLADSFTKDEAMSVMVNCKKALERAPAHRFNYAINIVDKVFAAEETGDFEFLSEDIGSVLAKGDSEALKGERIYCHKAFDNTEYGMRLGQVMGLVAGSGVGKSTVALNLFRWFVNKNPDFHHFFIPLEQTVNEIANRWRTMCEGEERYYSKVHVLSNFAPNGTNRAFTLADIEDYLVKFQEITKKKVGLVVIDHIGALKKKGKDGENQGLIDICHQMKAFALRTNTFLIMQSQAPREKAGEGDLELGKSAAYGTVFFEAYCDFLVTIWQPVKLMYRHPKCPTVLAYKFCKIRNKRRGVDVIQEDVPYYLFFEPKNERLREMTQAEEKEFMGFDERARKQRKKDRKTDAVTYTKIAWEGEE